MRQANHPTSRYYFNSFLSKQDHLPEDAPNKDLVVQFPLRLDLLPRRPTPFSTCHVPKNFYSNTNLACTYSSKTSIKRFTVSKTSKDSCLKDLNLKTLQPPAIEIWKLQIPQELFQDLRHKPLLRISLSKTHKPQDLTEFLSARPTSTKLLRPPSSNNQETPTTSFLQYPLQRDTYSPLPARPTT